MTIVRHRADFAKNDAIFEPLIIESFTIARTNAGGSDILEGRTSQPESLFYRLQPAADKVPERHDCGSVFGREGTRFMPVAMKHTGLKTDWMPSGQKVAGRKYGNIVAKMQRFLKLTTPELHNCIHSGGPGSPLIMGGNRAFFNPPKKAEPIEMLIKTFLYRPATGAMSGFFNTKA